jgi:hypothetical protein
VIEPQLLPVGSGVTIGRAGGRSQLGQALDAQVVGPALEDRPVEGAVEVLFEEWQVLACELVLQRPCGGRDDDVAAREDRRDEVAQRLAGARAGAHDQVAPLGHRRGDRVGHLDLARATLAAPGQCRHDPPKRPGGGVGLAVARRHLAGRRLLDLGLRHRRRP